ncbi:effector-associated domain 2-containing protein [Saccharothrix xinjiangensis]|uniref:TIR domain-containing protein n=1 Tax=Saccharothrix xinjiangensis TaxID=204798 RepID=A0ABV9YD42_9PSEU
MVTDLGAGTAQLRLQGELVSALARCECLRTEHGRAMLVDLLSDVLGEPVHLEGQEAHLQLLGLVRWCGRRGGGLNALVDCLSVLEPHAPELDLLRDLADEWTACRALPTRDWDRLGRVLRSVRLAEDPAEERRLLRLLTRVACAGRCDDMPARCRTVWSVFLHLADHNAGPGALPPAMVFVDCLAGRVGDGALADELRRYNWRWAERFEVTDLVERADWRTGLNDREVDAVHLVFEVDPDPEDPDKVVFSHWRYWAGSGGNTGRRGDAQVLRADLETEVDNVIAELEVELGTTTGGPRVSAIVVEFTLPWEMINTPVEFWRKASLSDVAVPLAMDHPVVLRSLERMRAQRYWLAWKQRWSAMSGEGASPRLYWSRDNGGWDLTDMAVELKDNSIVSLVLSEPPGDRRGRAWHEAALAFRAGIPIIIWDREDCSNLRFHEVVTKLFEGGEVRGLPHRVAELRAESLRSRDPIEPHLGRTLAVLWDDAERLPEPPAHGWGSQGGI